MINEMHFVETISEFKHLLSTLDSTEQFFFHLFVEDQETHPSEVKPLILLIKNINNNDTFAVSFSHPDVVNIDTRVLEKIAKSSCRKIIVNKKDTNHIVSFENAVDISLHAYYRNKSKIQIDLPRCKSNKSIPIMMILKKFNDTFESIVNVLNTYEPPTDKFINDLSEVLCEMEKSKIFSEKNNRLLNTQYNLFTPTSRPSNRYNNINFLALNKKEGERNDYVSRYGDAGAMAMIDYESYHLRLFANHVGYNLPNESLHTYLGKLYHGKDELTEDEYDLSKKITFNLMYGGITQDIIDNVPFMKSIHDYIMEVKDFYQKNNFVETWIYKRRIYSDVFDDTPNPYKVFNYLLQSAETERNCKVLKNILQFIDGKPINLPLYTYDAFLFDLHKCEFNSIKDIIKIMNPDGQFPLKLYVGRTYGDLAEIHV